MNNKIVLIGCGNVGVAYAYALVNQNTYVSELVMIDINTEKTMGEVMDLNHCLAYSPSKIKIRLGDYSDCKDARIVVIAAGANQKPGETRMDLIYKNASIFESIIKEIKDSGFNGIYIIATNPLDVMTYLTLKYSETNPKRVIGTGAVLDTARLRYILSERLNMCPKDIDAYVIGEHGDSEFIPWSNANVAFKKIKDYLSEEEMCIIEDKKIILPVSSYDKVRDVCISTPTIVGSKGVSSKIEMPLNEEEKSKLDESIKIIKDAISNVLNK